MAEGSKPEVFHSDDIHSEYLEAPGQPVGEYNGLSFFLFNSHPRVIPA